MIEAEDYINIVKTYFDFLVSEFNFKIFEEKIRGNVFYDIQYKNESCIISVSYENIEDYLLVMITLLQDGELPNHNDTTRTFYLENLNSKVFPLVNKGMLRLNNKYFSKFVADSQIEKKILKLAKELHLSLKVLDNFNKYIK